MTASVVGAMLDAERRDAEAYRDVRARMFGMSAVSGSSVAAAVIRAALADAKPDGKPPCLDRASDKAWFGSIAGVSAAGPWRDCLEKIVSGDFLSSVMAGLVYRDNFPLPLWVDRAALLEQAIERRYREIVEGTQGSCPTAESATPDRGVCRLFGYHPAPHEGKDWLPVLFLNATSGSTGRRIIISDVLAASERPHRDSTAAAASSAPEPLFPLAYDLCELRGGCKADPADIRLSTAAVLSARFPIISPYGALRQRNSDKAIADRVVDGGYFDDGGLATAADVVATLKGAGLDPVVIQVTNHPIMTEQHQELDRSRPPLPAPGSRSWFDTYTSIATAINATRSGHEDGYERYLDDMLQHNPERLFRIEVRPLEDAGGSFCRPGQSAAGRMQEVSISWWMSQPMQSYLDRQLCSRNNGRAIEQALQISARREPPPR